MRGSVGNFLITGVDTIISFVDLYKMCELLHALASKSMGNFGRVDQLMVDWWWT